MAEKVEIIIEAEDNASGPIENVGDALDNLSSTATKENLRDFKDAGVAAFSAIGDSVGQLIKIAADDELVMMRMNAQLKALGETANVSEDDIIKLADQLSKLSGFDDEALIEGQTTLLRFGNLSKEQFEQATKAAADLAAMTGMDLVSAFRQVGIALDNPEQGFGRLKRQIGDLTEEQQAAIDKMLEMGDVAGAQGLILDALSGKVNGTAEAFGDSFEGKVGKATVTVENFESAVGDLIIKPLPQWLVNVGVAAGETGSLLGPVVSSLADLAIVSMALSKGGALTGVAVGLKALAAVVVAPFALAIAAVGTTIAAILALGAAIAVLIMGLKVLGPSIKQNIIDPFATLVKVLWEKVRTDLEQFAANLVAKAKEKFGEVGAAIVQGIWDGIKRTWPLLLGNLPLFLYNLLKVSQAQIGAQSPSKLWAEQIGKPMAQGVQVGFGKQMTLAAAPIAETLTPADYRRGGGGGGGGATNVTLVYSPAVSIASRAEAETVLGPYINDVLRQLRK